MPLLAWLTNLGMGGSPITGAPADRYRTIRRNITDTPTTLRRQGTVSSTVRRTIGDTSTVIRYTDQ